MQNQDDHTSSFPIKLEPVKPESLYRLYSPHVFF